MARRKANFTWQLVAKAEVAGPQNVGKSCLPCHTKVPGLVSGILVCRDEMEKRIDTHFDKQDADIADLKSAVAELGGQLRDYHQKMIMLARIS